MSQENYVSEQVRDEVRAAIEDRAIWLYLIVKELSKEKKLKEIPEISTAIFKFGEMKGGQMPPAQSPAEWARNLISSPVGKQVFEQKLVKEADDEAVIEFSYCPLVKAWRKQGASDKEVALLCKMARCGDYGRIASFPLELKFEKLLAEGDNVCRLIVKKQDT